MTVRLHRGYTLIEVMLVVTIVGVLSSVAIPAFTKVELRAKQAERNIMLTSIQRAVDDYYMRENHFPYDDGSGATWLYLTTTNPDGTPGPYKRPWRLTAANALDHWPRITLAVQGAVFYNYYGLAYEQAGTRQTYLEGDGDLDGDGLIDELGRWWIYSGTQLQRVAGQSCNDCSQEVRIPASGLAF